MTALQRQEPGDPRAKAIEAMARRLTESFGYDVKEAYRSAFGTDLAEVALAALEAEGWGLTSTREASTCDCCEKPALEPVHGEDGELCCAPCALSLLGAERDLYRKALREIRAKQPPQGNHEAWNAFNIARGVLSSVPVEEEEKP